jgi:hypothetical protein
VFVRLIWRTAGTLLVSKTPFEKSQNARYRFLMFCGRVLSTAFVIAAGWAVAARKVTM